MFNALFRARLQKNLEGKELTDEKIRDFRRLVLAQGGIIASIFLLDLFSYFGFPFHTEIAETIFFAMIGLYSFFLWDMLRNYTHKRGIILFNFIVIMGVFVSGVIGVNPFIPMPPTPAYRIFVTFVQVALLTVECTVIAYTLVEFFRKDHGLTLRLWGSASLYLMIGLAFGSVYEILCILDIQCLGDSVPLRAMGMMKRIEYSLSVLTGMESPYAHISDMLHSMGAVEALWGQIFIVLIVGRLLIK